MNYLALDYGEHRVGVAFADSEFRMAFSRETIDQKTTNLFVRLDELVKINKVDAFVVGMPYHPDGRKDGKNVVVEKFIEDLKTRFPGMPVYTQDECPCTRRMNRIPACRRKKRLLTLARRKSKRIRRSLTSWPLRLFYNDGLMNKLRDFSKL